MAANLNLTPPHLVVELETNSHNAPVAPPLSGEVLHYGSSPFQGRSSIMAPPLFRGGPALWLRPFSGEVLHYGSSPFQGPPPISLMDLPKTNVN